MFINDVGQNTWEEINDGIAGANYGWPDTEGRDDGSEVRQPEARLQPLAAACAITGGAFYAPLDRTRFPAEYLNDYFFADYCGGWIRRLDPAAGNTVVPFATRHPVSRRSQSRQTTAACTTSRADRVPRPASCTGSRTAASAPSITTHPSSQTVAPGASVTFSVRASGPPPLRYQWQRNGVNISGATAQDYTIVAVAGRQRRAVPRHRQQRLSATCSATQPTLTVTANQPPTGTITQPAAGTLYSGGSVISYAGTATDPEDGTLPASAFTWRVDFHHDTPTSIRSSRRRPARRSGSFTIPTTGHTEANVWYRIYLTVRDSGGLDAHHVQRDVLSAQRAPDARDQPRRASAAARRPAGRRRR